jgi:hypothetical protein
MRTKAIVIVGIGMLASACRPGGAPAVPSSGELAAPGVPPLPSGQGMRPQGTCQIQIVPTPPAHAVKVGETTVDGEPGRPLLESPEARQFACSLGATHAVTELAYADRTGPSRWVLDLYRVPFPGEPTLDVGKGPNTWKDAAPGVDPPERERPVGPMVPAVP